MKKALPLILALAVTPAFAGEDGNFFVGLKSGNFDIDAGELDADTPVGFVFGYKSKIGWGVEFEANSADVDYFIMGQTGTVDYKTQAIYGVYRSPGDVYFKGKAGYLREELENSLASEDDTGFSAGIGVGAILGAISLEAEFTVIEEDVNYFSIGANFNF